MGRVVYYRVSCWDGEFSNFIHRAREGLHSDNSVRVIGGHWHCLDGGGWLY
jgi:hypothetical protein